MFNIIFPQYTNQHYWNIHYKYLLNIFEYLKCNIQYKERPELIVTINNKDFLFDYYDYHDLRAVKRNDLPIFKFHCHEETNQVFCFPSVSFYDWNEYYQLEEEIKYNPKESDLISSRQLPYAGALKRRLEIQKLLNYHFGNKILLKVIPQIDYWKEIEKISIAVFIPGWCNNMIDRGHIQFMGFGCCTISSNLPEKLPFNQNFVENVHYIKCKDDYSNLIDLLNDALLKNKYIEIGRSAKILFKKTYTPKIIGELIRSKLDCI